ncbi:unnamed protein product [Macrosiphum euphorbiae]|uniref:Bromo domain-containing protein n=1 Tax=Macrosiphum euphorbiae TaxID=13131 RepID=A0AAV0WLE9_9HEMI|nr:unnamed protein product [Macrosiphum euphorbiae]
MCKDMNTISRNLGDDDDPENISIGTIGRKIVERILMELYCNIDGSDFFRERHNKNVFPRYYKNIVHAVALNDVRDFLINKIKYKLSEVVEDLKLVLVNAMSYFEVSIKY